MNKISFLIVVALVCSQPLFALLSPLNQSAVEIEEILKSPELNQLLPQNDPILSIQKEDNKYEIRTKNAAVTVIVEYQTNQMPGAQQFRLRFQNPLRAQ